MRLDEAGLKDVQQLVVRAFRVGELEDGTSLPHFPDMNYVLEADELVVSARGLAGSMAEADRVLDPEELSRLAGERGELPFLEFREPEITDDVLRIAVDICLGFADLEPLRLGAVVFAFRREAGGGWSTAEPPRALAY